MTLILASASPRRSELLARAGIPFLVAPADVDEAVLPGEDARAYVARVAADKARVGRERHPDAWVLAADTTVVVDGEILAKAEDDAEATAMVTKLSGRAHLVLTATCLLGPGGEARRVVETEVTMRALDPEEIASYVAGGEWRGKAGAYGAQGQAAGFMVAVRGSYTNIIGLPLAEVLVDLVAHGVARPRYA